MLSLGYKSATLIKNYGKLSLLFLAFDSGTRWRGSSNGPFPPKSATDILPVHSDNDGSCKKEMVQVNWRRILLLIIAITVHNIPGIIITMVRCIQQQRG